MIFLLCQECSVLVPWVWTGTCPSLGLKVRRFLPSTVPLLEGDEPLDLLSCLHDDHLSAIKEKTGVAKSSNAGCWLQTTEWNPWAAAVRSCSAGVGFGSPLAEGRLWWPSQAHRCSGRQAVCRLCVQLPPHVGRIVKWLFFKCYVVHIPFPVQAELNSQKADLCWIPLCPHCGLSQVLVVLPWDFYP